jgi:hypothetical protein
MIDHRWDCYAPTPTESVQETVGRAVRSLARKGLLEREYDGRGPKCLVVYLPTVDRTQLPEAQRLQRQIMATAVLGIPLRGRRR